MNILITNDDGIFSEGIRVLAKSLSREHNVLVVAPDGERSGFSHSITLSKEIRLEEVFLNGAFRSYSISGTPADCVKFAVSVFSDFHADIVCSGINRGANLGSDVLYSGTVSAALEANCCGLPAIAFSSAAHGDNLFDTCGVIALKILDSIYDYLDTSFVLNVNVPNVSEKDIKGIKMTKLGVNIYSDEYVPLGANTFRLTGVPIDHDGNDEDCDVEWIKKNFVTATPVLYNRTDYKSIEILAKKIKI